MTVRRDVDATNEAMDTVIEQRDVTVEAVAERAVDWGSVLAGLVTAFGAFIPLSLLALALGIGPAADDPGVATIGTIVASAIALFSFFAGGYIAAWSSGVADARRGALNGFLVWALWLALLLIGAGAGLGSLFGAAGDLLNQIRVPELTRQEIVDALRSGALGTFLALAVSAIAALLGGIVGTRGEGRGRTVRT